MHPTPEYPLVFHCGHAGTYPSIQEGAKLDELLERISQQKCPPCNRAMHYQPPAGASDAELYAAKYEREKLPTGHAAHKKIRDTAKLLRECRACGEQRLRRTIAKYPPESIKGAHARRQAEIFGVK